MKITDIIRGVLDIIDCADAEKPQEPAVSVSITKPVETQADEDELARMKILSGLLSKEQAQYSNSPQEMISSVDNVIASGTDVHQSKHPSDIRSDSMSMYPFHQHRPGV